MIPLSHTRCGGRTSSATGRERGARALTGGRRAPCHFCHLRLRGAGQAQTVLACPRPDHTGAPRAPLGSHLSGAGPAGPGLRGASIT